MPIKASRIEDLTWDILLDNSRRIFENPPVELTERLEGGDVPFLSTYGGGLNSAAGLLLLRKLDIVPDAILFADTGGEKPETYAHIKLMAKWCAENGFPLIITVKKDVDHSKQKHEQKYNTLEEECLAKKCLPSIAYFGRSCSIKWKHEPQNKWMRAWDAAQRRWAQGKRILKSIYYDAGEHYRAKVSSDKGCQFWHPLLDYDWGRDECVAAIRLSGLPLPPKSSCFYCPEMKPHEILALPPDLLARALAMEDNAELTAIKGLGKHDYSWRELVNGKVSLPLCSTESSMPCGCYDGE